MGGLFDIPLIHPDLPQGGFLREHESPAALEGEGKGAILGEGRQFPGIHLPKEGQRSAGDGTRLGDLGGQQTGPNRPLQFIDGLAGACQKPGHPAAVEGLLAGFAQPIRRLPEHRFQIVLPQRFLPLPTGLCPLCQRLGVGVEQLRQAQPQRVLCQRVERGPRRGRVRRGVRRRHPMRSSPPM